jgi:lysozyme family protein
MATFEAAIPVLMEHEGGIANVSDGEGITAFGWTLRTCRALGIQQPKTKEEAEALFHTHFWLPVYEKIASQAVATKIFDDAVNQGPMTAHKLLQVSLHSIGAVVKIDGIFGPATLTAVNAVPEELLLPWMRLHQYISYDLYIHANQDEREKYRGGLSRRAAWPDPDKAIAPTLLNCTYRPEPIGGNSGKITNT